LGENDQETLAKAVEYRNNYFIEKPKELYDPVSLGQLLVLYLDAGAPADALRWIRENGKIILPEKTSQTKSEGSLIGAMAMHTMEARFSEQELWKAKENFLRRQINDWLTRGRELHAVNWLKLAHWRKGVSPKDIVLKSRDYLITA
jgi:hypothetical protein